MRRFHIGICLMGLFPLMIAGCWTTQPNLKPPPPPESFILPPADDSRFSAPIEYPRGTLENDLIKQKSQNGPGNAPPTTPRFGAGPAGGPGY
jgi:hypothetical protein